jgi:hypothetical protein
MARTLALFSLIALVSGCVPPVFSATHGPIPSALFSSFKGPIDVAPSQERIGNKTGEACSMTILGLISIGDSSIENAARNGGIQKVSTMNYSIMSVLGGIFYQYCLIVTGD